MEKKPFLKVDHSEADVPFVVRRMQKSCSHENLDVNTSIEKDVDGSRKIITFIFCDDCGKSSLLEAEIPNL